LLGEQGETNSALLLAEFGRDIAVLRWPAEADERDSLVQLGVPHLWLVAAGAAPPPTDGGCLEDWTRLPADTEDVRARLAALAQRAEHHTVLPRLDDFGQLSHRGKRAQLSPTEERIVRRLLMKFGEPVSDAELASDWPDDAPTKGAIRVHISRARRRIRPLGLEIRSRRAVGHLIQETATSA
jgi:hypothetical protein